MLFTDSRLACEGEKFEVHVSTDILRKQTHWKKRGCQERIRVHGDIVKFDENQRAECSEEMGTVMARCNKRRGWGG